jgi:SAM-dependent methyltransferase
VKEITAMPESVGRGFYDREYFEARTRESLPHSRDVIYPLSERTARFLRRRCAPQRALDIGCAKGFLVEALLAQGIPAAFGLDISLYAVGEGGPTTRGRLLVADVLAGLPMHSASCDLITALDVFEHLPDPGPVLAEIRRVLSPDGAAYLKICHPAHPNARRDPSHVNVQPLVYWRRAFRQAGFAAERIYEAEFTPAEGWGGILKTRVRRWREWAVIGRPADYKFLLRKLHHG